MTISKILVQVVDLKEKSARVYRVQCHEIGSFRSSNETTNFVNIKLSIIYNQTVTSHSASKITNCSCCLRKWECVIWDKLHTKCKFYHKTFIFAHLWNHYCWELVVRVMTNFLMKLELNLMCKETTMLVSFNRWSKVSLFGLSYFCNIIAAPRFKCLVVYITQIDRKFVL